MSKNKPRTMPYIKAIASALATAWIVAAVTWSRLIDMFIELLIVYSAQVSPYGGYTLMAAVILTVITVVVFIRREMNEEAKLLKNYERDLKQEKTGLDTLETDYELA